MRSTLTYLCSLPGLKIQLMGLILVVLTQAAFGQEITISKGGTTIDKGDSVRSLENKAKETFQRLKVSDPSDSFRLQLSEKFLKANIYDSLQAAMNSKEALKKSAKDSIGNIFKVKKIYSEKYLNHVFDSLTQHLDWERYKALMDNPQAGYEDLMHAINKKFSYFPDQSRYKQDAERLSGIDKKELLSNDEFSSVTDLLSRDSLQKEFLNFRTPELEKELMPVQGMHLKSKHLEKLDSLRKIDLKEKGLCLKEMRVDTLTKANIFQNKPRFADKTYFEGIIGILEGKESITILQISPSLAYRFTNTFSVGAGLNLLLQDESRRINVQSGMRIFSKQEFYGNRLYVQVEDMVSFTGGGLLTEQRETSTRHSFLSGGGCLLPVSKTLSLNISVLYRFTGDSTVASPWVVRIGLGSKTKKGHAKK